MKKRTIALMMAVVMLFGAVIGGTIAWLTSKTDPVVNTFTVGDVSIKLEETGTTTVDNVETKSYQLVPGTTYLKDPVVSIVTENTNVDCYLFVEFTEENDPSTYLTYTSTLTSANNWTLLTGKTNIWYRIVGKDDPVKSWNLLTGNTAYPNGYVTIKDTVTKQNMAEAAKAKLSWTAYAVQKDNFTTAEAAWDATFGAPTP